MDSSANRVSRGSFSGQLPGSKILTTPAPRLAILVEQPPCLLPRPPCAIEWSDVLDKEARVDEMLRYFLASACGVARKGK
jgi:hypothetical protein